MNIKNTEALIVDEVSMVSAKVLEKVCMTLTCIEGHTCVTLKTAFIFTVIYGEVKIIVMQ